MKQLSRICRVFMCELLELENVKLQSLVDVAHGTPGSKVPRVL
jgi:hypothetical protein